MPPGAAILCGIDMDGHEKLTAGLVGQARALPQAEEGVRIPCQQNLHPGQAAADLLPQVAGNGQGHVLLTAAPAGQGARIVAAVAGIYHNAPQLFPQALHRQGVQHLGSLRGSRLSQRGGHLHRSTAPQEHLDLAQGLHFLHIQQLRVGREVQGKHPVLALATARHGGHQGAGRRLQPFRRGQGRQLRQVGQAQIQAPGGGHGFKNWNLGQAQAQQLATRHHFALQAHRIGFQLQFTLGQVHGALQQPKAEKLAQQTFRHQQAFRNAAWRRRKVQGLPIQTCEAQALHQRQLMPPGPQAQRAAVHVHQGAVQPQQILHTKGTLGLSRQDPGGKNGLGLAREPNQQFPIRLRLGVWSGCPGRQ